jgi:hypothetical protein
MSEQPDGQNPDSKLEPLDFRLLNDDGKAAVYQAVTVAYEHPQVPVYTVTVTIASAVRREAEEQLQSFLSEMKAAFSLLPELPPDDYSPDDDSPDDEDSFDIETQMGIELNLVSIRGLKDDELVGVSAIVATTIGPGGDTSGSDVAVEAAVRAVAPNTIPPGGKDHYWWAFCNRRLDGTVTPSGGSGTMRQWKKDNGTPVGLGNPETLYDVRQIIVRSAGGMAYAFGGPFKGPHAGPRPGKPC